MLADADDRRFEPIATRVEEVLAEDLFAATPPAAACGIAFALVVGWTVADHAGAWLAAGWCALKTGIGLGRILQARRFRRDRRHNERLRRWIRAYAGLVTLDVASWAAMLPLFAPGAAPETVAMLMCGLVGVASVKGATMFWHWRISAYAIFICLLPLMGLFLVSDAAGHVGISVGAVVYFLILGIEARRSHDRLEEVLRLRFENAALADARAEALADAARSSEAKSRFLAVVSHEMRTPLNGIMGIAQLLRSRNALPALTHPLTLLENSARLLSRIIADLLDVSRMDSGAVDIRPLPLDLRRTVEETVELLRPLAETRGLSLHLEWDPTLPRQVLGDATRIGQVLLNLGGNAVKFTERGGVVLRGSAPAPGRFRIEVVDTGQGISPADQERIFKPFERLGEVGVVQGTGLGLTIARRIAQALGGDVSCVSTPGHGSTFTFEFAAASVDGPPQDDAGPGAASCAGTPPAADSRGTVLVVDDNEINSDVATGLLEMLGWRHEVARNGEEALAAMSARAYAAVLMDCHMPVLDGWEATRRWRRDERAGRLPIIGITANASEADRRTCLDAGMDEHIPKPFEIAVLAEALDRFTARPVRARG